MEQAQLTWRGTVRVTTRFLDGTVEVEEFPNLITDAGLNLLRDALAGGNADIHYLALGNNLGATSPAAGDTVLDNERFRKEVTSTETTGTGAVLTTVYVAPAEATDFTIEEIGWFAGDTATASADTGTLLARVLYSREKTSVESLQIDRTDTLTRGA